MLDSPDKFEDDKLYSNTITQQNERQSDIVLDSSKQEHYDKLSFSTIC